MVPMVSAYKIYVHIEERSKHWNVFWHVYPIEWSLRRCLQHVARSFTRHHNKAFTVDRIKGVGSESGMMALHLQVS